MVAPEVQIEIVAAAGIMIVCNPPTGPMHQEAKAAGKFKPDYAPEFDRLQIITAQQLIDGEKMTLLLMMEVAKKAKKAEPRVEQGIFILTATESQMSIADPGGNVGDEGSDRMPPSCNSTNYFFGRSFAFSTRFRRRM